MHERGRKRHRSALVDRELREEDGVTFGWDDFGYEDPFSNVQGRELLDIFSENIEQLPKRYRDVLHMRRFGELSLKEVSERMQISVMGVKSRQYRAKEMLKRKMRGTEWLKN
jgi:RNA polymerase sigma factor (sigma-70 family)